ncbi:E3 ubiquitin-protein ligase RING1 [Beauveria bassiana D1-5]|uniref:E3 ubiquitin-protein ligase RING1 n=1 Tax=Beauveria bassiana D1-5 TaxID=1245745 RepID=A0A0A2VP01_BEABA|nr:E3 ubiquitin-protein ligase RING1 [Beauveria bassiana D1-5]
MPFDRRLNAEAREVVFCHTCSSEWYGREWGLMCPACSGEITEIVTLENDPRPAREGGSDDLGYSSSSASEYEEVYLYIPSLRDRDLHREDEYIHGPHYHMHAHAHGDGFGHHHSTRIGHGADHYHAYPGQSVERFLNVASDLGMPMGGNMRHHLHEASQNGRGHHGWDDGTSRGFVTFHHSPGHAPPGSDPFHTIFSSVFHDHEGQHPGEAASAAARQGRGADANTARNTSGVQGDAVTDEALEQIISTLTPHVPVRPLTSEQALANLPRKTIRAGSTDGDTDCSICMDSLTAGQVALALPCKHLFHEKCGLEWLKDHDTCPSLVDCQSKTERGPNMDVDQIAFRYQDSVRVIDAIHSALADHQTMNIQHQDPQDHTASQKQCGFSPCAMVAMVAMVAMEAMVSEAHLATTPQVLTDAAQGRRQALEW